MFDTSRVRTRTVDGSKRMGVLTISLAVHSAAVVAVVSATLASVQFPSSAPDQLQVFTPVLAPSVPPPPLGVRAPAPAQKEPAAAAPKVVTAPPVPTVVPDAIPQPEVPVSSGGATQSSATGTGTEIGPPGDPTGVIGGVDVGQGPATGSGAPATDVTYRPGGEVIAARVLRRVEPNYPTVMIRAKVPATVTLRCVIDRNGQIRDPEIVKSTHAAFNAAVLDAVRQWKFAPGSMRGQAVDTWFELTVRFDVR